MSGNNECITPLTSLSEDEQFFYDTVKDFAKEKVQPLVREMDDAGAINKN